MFTYRNTAMPGVSTFALSQCSYVLELTQSNYNITRFAVNEGLADGDQRAEVEIKLV